MNECLVCEYKGTNGFWRGRIRLNNGRSLPLTGMVYEEEGGTFDLDPLIERHNIDKDTVEEISGEASCPNCGSESYYSCGDDTE